VTDAYLTIASEAQGEYKEKGSKFMAYAYPIQDEEMFEFYLDRLKSLHPKARHHCYAYKLGLDMNRYRINDDGEPSGTAGKPILGQIQSYNLTDVLVVVVRYFGGTKLGATGLIRAYKEATQDALNHAEIVEKYLTAEYELNFGYEQMGHILNILKEIDVEIIHKAFEANCYVKIEVRLSKEVNLIHTLKAKLLGKTMEEVTPDTVIPFCSIDRIKA